MKMQKRTLIGAALLVAVGIIFGALLVMSFNNVRPGFGFSGARVELGGPAPIGKADLNLMATQNAFIRVSKSVTPTVVSVTVTTTPKIGAPFFFHNFQFNFPEPAGKGSRIGSHRYFRRLYNHQ